MISLLYVFLWSGCDSTQTVVQESSNEVNISPNDGHLGKLLSINQVTPLFTSTLLEYQFDSVKKKTKSTDWVELSATYKNAGNKLKVVINDYLPNGNPQWKTLFADLEQQSTNGYQAAFNEKNNKSTWMVLVGQRFRVDFKSSTEDQQRLMKLAEQFDYKTLEAMSR